MEHPVEPVIKKAGPMTSEEISDFLFENGYTPVDSETIEDSLSDEDAFAQDPEGRWHLKTEA